MVDMGSSNVANDTVLDITKEERRSGIIEFVDLATAAQGLCDLQEEIRQSQTVSRPIAAAIESISEGTLGRFCSVASFTERPSFTNLKATQESISERIADILLKLFDMMAKLYHKVVEIAKSLYEKIRSREDLYVKEKTDNDNYRKANSSLFASLSDTEQKEVRDHAAEVDAGISKTIESNYTKLFHSFLDKDDVYKAQQTLAPLFKPYLDYLTKRMHAYIDLSYQLARFKADNHVDRLTQAITTLKDATFEPGKTFINACYRLKLEIDEKEDLTFSSALYGYRLLIKSLKKEKGEKAPTYKEFSTAKLWLLSYDDGVDISKLITDINSLAEKMEAIKPQGDDIDQSLITLYTSAGVVIRKEVHSILDFSSIASEVMGIRLIAIRLEAQKARAMYELIKTKAKAEAVAKAEAMIKEKE